MRSHRSYRATGHRAAVSDLTQGLVLVYARVQASAAAHDWTVPAEAAATASTSAPAAVAHAGPVSPPVVDPQPDRESIEEEIDRLYARLAAPAEDPATVRVLAERLEVLLNGEAARIRRELRASARFDPDAATVAMRRARDLLTS